MVTSQQIDEALEQVNSQYEEAADDSQRQYDQWLEALHSWIDLPPGALGELGTKLHEKKTGELMVPLKGRKLIIQNLLLRKANMLGWPKLLLSILFWILTDMVNRHFKGCHGRSGILNLRHLRPS